MKHFLLILFVLLYQFATGQQYDTLVYDTENTDTNNQVYKLGNVYVFDYEIIEDGVVKKLKTNTGMFMGRKFELVPATSDSIGVNTIHMIVKPISEAEKSNENQTEITYIQMPALSMMSTGVIDNTDNVWIHPTRAGFFNALETCPFPFVKTPLKIGKQWSDKLIAGNAWKGDKWGQWEGKLLLSYDYNITNKETIKTDIGDIECFVIESTATSKIGKTYLKSYYSETYGFVRYEYELVTGIKINMWLIDYKENQEFNNGFEIHKTGQYIKQ